MWLSLHRPTRIGAKQQQQIESNPTTMPTRIWGGMAAFGGTFDGLNVVLEPSIQPMPHKPTFYGYLPPTLLGQDNPFFPQTDSVGMDGICNG